MFTTLLSFFSIFSFKKLLVIVIPLLIILGFVIGFIRLYEAKERLEERNKYLVYELKTQSNLNRELQQSLKTLNSITKSLIKERDSIDEEYNQQLSELKAALLKAEKGDKCVNSSIPNDVLKLLH